MISIKTGDNSRAEAIKVYAGDTIQQEIIKIWSTEADTWVYEAEGETTGILPLTIHSDGTACVDYRIYGNTENGESVGERTENLFDINNLCSMVVVQGQTFTKPQSAYFFDVFSGTSGANIPMNLQKSIPVTSGTYMLSFEESETRIAVLFSDGETQKAVSTSSSVKVRTFDITSDGYISIRCENSGVCSVKKLQIVKASTAPDHYIPYGYKLPMVVRSKNLFDKNATDINNGYINNKILGDNGATSNSSNWIVSEYIEIDSQNVLINPFDSTPIPSTYPAICFYTSEYVYISGVRYNNINVHKIQVPANAKYARMSVFKAYSSSASIVDYEETPIYIGSDPLAEDESVSYGEQKVYRMEGGTLTPTDPPVPIPALPTIEGETIIDYNPSTTPAVEPEKMYIKYKPQ